MKILEKLRKVISGMTIFSLVIPMLFMGAAPAMAADSVSPIYNCSVLGNVGAVGLTVTGNTTGTACNTVISGILTEYSNPGQRVSFAGLISGDISGNVTGGVNYNGADTLFAEITDSGAVGHVYLTGIFAGADGDFIGNIFTQVNPINFTTAISITGGNSVTIGSTLQLSATTDGDGQTVAWAVYKNDSSKASIDQTTGLLTATGVGSVTVIANALDGSLVTQNHIVTVTPDETAPTLPSNGTPHGTSLQTNEFDFTWDASTDYSQPITYIYQTSQNPASSGGVLTSGLWTSGVLSTNLIHSSGAAQGTWYWQVRAIDAAGNQSAWSPIWNVNIDTTPPITGYAIAGGALGDNGWYKGTTAPVVTLSTEPGATIYWQWEGEGWNTGTSEQTPPVTEGARTLEFYSIDLATNRETPHQTVPVKYDRTAPTADNMNINEGATWTKFTAVDVYPYNVFDATGFNRISLSNDGINYTTFDWASPYVGWNLSGSDGQKNVYMKVVDVAGNESAVYTDTIRMDRVPPTVTNVEVVDRTTTPAVNYAPYVKGDASNRVRADVADERSGINTASCKYTLNGGSTWLAGSYNSSTRRCIADITGIADGAPLAVNVRVKDNAGNLTEGSIVYLTADSLSPSNGTTTLGPVYQDTMAGQVNMTVPMSDTSSVANCQFRYYFDGSFSNWVSGFWNATNQVCEIGFGGMQQGRIYELQMRGIDGVGHYGDAVTSGPKVVDSQAPTVEYLNPTPESGTATTQNSQTFKVNSDSDTASCVIDLDTVSNTMAPSGDGTWTYRPITLPDGPKNYTVTCVDHVGNTTTTGSRTLRVDTAKPVITLTGVTPDITIGGTYTELGALATDQDQGDGTFAAIPSGTVNTSLVGSYIITYNATDIAGNIATPVTRTVNVIAAPVASTVIVIAAPATQGPAPTTLSANTEATGTVNEVAGATTENQQASTPDSGNNGQVEGTTDNEDSPNWWNTKVLGMTRWIWLTLIALLLVGAYSWWLTLGKRSKPKKK